MTPLQILQQLRKTVLAQHSDKPEYDAALSSLLGFEFWLARASGETMNTFYVPLKCECGTEATRFESADQDCGNLSAYTPVCGEHGSGDYFYCLKCLGHVDGHGGDCKAVDCTCSNG